MSDRDLIWIDASILAGISDFSSLSCEEREMLVYFQGLYEKYKENEAIYRRFSHSDDEYDKSMCVQALNDNLSMLSGIYKLIETDEIKHILELHKSGKFSSSIDTPEVEVSAGIPQNVFCWKCGAKLLDNGDFCVKCGANATTFDEGVNRTVRTIKSKPYLKLDANKTKKILRISILLAVAAVVISLICCYAVDNAQNAELRNFAAETMREDYSNVYADVVSIEPEYFVYTSYSGSSYKISEVVCKCKTVEGKFIWVTIESVDYPGGGWNEHDFRSKTYDQLNPMRLSGRVTKSGDVIEDLADSIGEVYVLEVKDLQEYAVTG